jgi:hypothetical protein
MRTRIASSDFRHVRAPDHESRGGSSPISPVTPCGKQQHHRRHRSNPRPPRQSVLSVANGQVSGYQQLPVRGAVLGCIPCIPAGGTFRISRADMAVPARTPSGHDRPGRRLRHPPPETPPASRRRGRCDGGRRRTIRAVTAAGFTGADRRFPRRNPRDCGCRRRRSAHRLRGRRFRGRPGAPVRPRPRCAP